ncbi:MAG: gamma-glutamyltransferase [Proteobacteria bacterium]|nr:gamma-glutamyltransferase [Pseudomonadota bacterium]MBU4277563.1 gamma-glutamyltransferase [Pseudomonadota bacterium]MBU4384535.1 gamma-glutamyltransferase [Pseudomonadota bacterium]MBU4605513.1 gamma-glutamyltransferase [Pseudomonadota bacterium]
MAPQGMAASSHPLATRAGVRVLEDGGNAVDAAVAMVAVLTVVEPHSVAMGGDAFALLALEGGRKVAGLNASGRAPAAASVEAYRAQGHETVPTTGAFSVTVPGALAGWAEALERYGTMGLDTVLQPAITYAEKGFPVSPVIAGEWAQAEKLLSRDAAAAATYLIHGKAPKAGQVFTNPDLGRTYRRIAEQGPELFYQGELAEAVAACVQAGGGLMTPDDLAAHVNQWVEPVALDYRGHTVLELPPNGQGITALEVLGILSGYDLAGLEPGGAEYLHLLAEAIKIAFGDRDRYITDQIFAPVPVERLLSKDYGAACRQMIHPGQALSPGAAPPLNGDTVYLAVGDAQGNAASFISSIFTAFGSGLVVPGTGVLLHCRGRSFSLDPTHANRLEGGKRPMHTIIPGMLMKDGLMEAAFGVMGGDMQPQGHAQFLVNLLDFGLDLQAAMDAPRLRYMGGMSMYLEDGISQDSADTMAAWGHSVDQGPYPVNEVGGGQVVWRDQEQGMWLGASDRRKDGCAIGY